MFLTWTAPLPIFIIFIIIFFFFFFFSRSFLFLLLLIINESLQLFLGHTKLFFCLHRCTFCLRALSFYNALPPFVFH